MMDDGQHTPTKTGAFQTKVEPLGITGLERFEFCASLQCKTHDSASQNYF